MPLVTATADNWKRLRSRVLIAGEPNTRKTSSLLSWPRPLHVLISPGEKGAASIQPDPDNGVHVYVWEEESGKKTPSAMVVKEVKDMTTKILAGQFGPVSTFALDGLHKFYEFVMDSATDGDYLLGNDFDPKLYGPAGREIAQYMTTVMTSKVNNVVFTIWVAPEKDKQLDTGPKPSMHIYPDLPGKAAKRLLGEFTAVVYTKLVPSKPGSPPDGVFQIKPDNEVWGVGLKCPTHIAAKLPTTIPQTYEALMKCFDVASTGPAATPKPQG